MVVREGIDPREPLGDKLALQPDALAALHHIDLRERMPVAIGAGAAIAKFDLGAGGKFRQSLLRLVDHRPGTVTLRGDGRNRRLGIDEPDDRAVGELKRLAILDLGHRAFLRLGQLAGQG